MTKRILSVILALGVVLSLMINVSAISYPVVDGKSAILDFEDGVTSMFDIRTFGAITTVDKRTDDTAKVHGGNVAMKLTPNSSGIVKFWYSPSITFEPNASYYLSFWYYSDNWAGNTTGWNMGEFTKKDVNFYPAEKGKWNRAIAKLTVGGANVSDFAICCYNITTSGVVYIDDFEIAKVSSFETESNTIPAGATIVKSGKADFENLSTAGITPVTSTATKSITFDNAHWGEAALCYVGNAAAGAKSDYWLNIEDIFGISPAAGTYYMSYYIYSPNREITTRVSLYSPSTTTLVPETTVPQGQWTKVSGLFKMTADEAAVANQRLFRVYTVGAESDEIYFDDFVLAKFEGDVAEVALSQSAIDYDYENETATVTLNTTVGIEEVDAESITVPEGVEVTNVQVMNEGSLVILSLSGVKAGNIYSVQFANIKDLFGRTAAADVTVVTPAAYEMSGVTETVNGTDATYTIGIKKNNPGTTSVAFVVIAYDAEGIMTDIGMHTQNISKEAGEVPFEVTIEKGATYKVMTIERNTLASIE